MPVQIQVKLSGCLGAQADADLEGLRLYVRVEVEVKDRVDGVGGTDYGRTEIVGRDDSSGAQRRIRDDQADTAVNPDGHVDQRQAGDLPGAGTGMSGPTTIRTGRSSALSVPPYWRVRRSRSA